MLIQVVEYSRTIPELYSWLYCHFCWKNAKFVRSLENYVDFCKKMQSRRSIDDRKSQNSKINNKSQNGGRLKVCWLSNFKVNNYHIKKRARTVIFRWRCTGQCEDTIYASIRHYAPRISTNMEYIQNKLFSPAPTTPVIKNGLDRTVTLPFIHRIRYIE